MEPRIELPRRRPLPFWGILALLSAALGALPVAAEKEERRSFDSRELVVRNLIGEVHVTGHGGSAFEVTVRVQGKDAGRPGLEIVTRQGASGELSVKFPPSDRYVYPRLGAGSRTTISRHEGQGGSWLGELLESLVGDEITVRGSGSGLEIWADVDVKVPAGGSVTVAHGVGQIEAADVRGNATLQVRSGHVAARDVRGDLVVDTGSGHVEASAIEGRLNIDTGSGHVEVRNHQGPELHVDTGSGHVELTGIEAQRLFVDTGSGHVEADSVDTDSAEIDTGSGSVSLELGRMGRGSFKVDTGSGGIELAVPHDASIDVSASTGSGNIDLDLGTDAVIRHRENDDVRLRLGSGEAQVHLDTGSGGIRIRYSN